MNDLTNLPKIELIIMSTQMLINNLHHEVFQKKNSETGNFENGIKVKVFLKNDAKDDFDNIKNRIDSRIIRILENSVPELQIEIDSLVKTWTKLSRLDGDSEIPENFMRKIEKLKNKIQTLVVKKNNLQTTGTNNSSTPESDDALEIFHNHRHNQNKALTESRYPKTLAFMSQIFQKLKEGVYGEELKSEAENSSEKIICKETFLLFILFELSHNEVFMEMLTHNTDEETLQDIKNYIPEIFSKMFSNDSKLSNFTDVLFKLKLLPTEMIVKTIMGSSFADEKLEKERLSCEKSMNNFIATIKLDRESFTNIADLTVRGSTAPNTTHHSDGVNTLPASEGFTPLNFTYEAGLFQSIISQMGEDALSHSTTLTALVPLYIPSNNPITNLFASIHGFTGTIWPHNQH
jgi:hypothetical protein